MAHCQNDTNVEITKMHIINLAVLQNFFSDSELNEILKTNALETQPRINIPQPQIYKTQFDNEIEKLEANELSLKSLTAESKEDTKIYQSLSHRIWHGLQTNSFEINSSSLSVSSWQSIMLISTIIVVIVLSIAIFGLNKKLKAITTIVILLQKPSVAQAIETVDKQAILDYFKERPTTLTPESFILRSPILDNNINPLDVIFLVLFIQLGMYVAWRSYRIFHPRYQTNIIIEIGNQESNVRVKVLTIPHSPLDYSFTASAFIKSISVTGQMNTKICISWPTFTITHKFAPLVYTLPNMVCISCLTARRITRLLESKYYCLVFTTDCDGRIKLIDLPKTNWHLGTQSTQIDPDWPLSRNTMHTVENEME
jgi:hypothetical protein